MLVKGGQIYAYILCDTCIYSEEWRYVTHTSFLIHTRAHEQIRDTDEWYYNNHFVTRAMFLYSFKYTKYHLYMHVIQLDQKLYSLYLASPTKLPAGSF